MILGYKKPQTKATSIDFTIRFCRKVDLPPSSLPFASEVKSIRPNGKDDGGKC
jgi:hypothetical protein